VAESALIVRVPEAETAVRHLRQRCDPSAAIGVPAHITILIPFMSPERITSQVLRQVKTALAASRPFSFTLDEVGRWPETTYLVPKPAAPFVQMTRALVEAFPDYPPYGGRHSGVVPHLTVADRDAVLAKETEGELRAILAARGPVTSVCKAVDIYENSSGIWRFMHAIALDSDG
jgi:2'-5' RNA ligase